MNPILKHSFEALSLLTTTNGMLEVTIIPAMNQPDWIIPSGLILSVDDYYNNDDNDNAIDDNDAVDNTADHYDNSVDKNAHKPLWRYLWSQQEVAVFHLTPHNQPTDKIIVLEGNTDAHRLALQTVGELRQIKVRISDVKDAELPDGYVDDSIDRNINTIKAPDSNEAEAHVDNDVYQPQHTDGSADSSQTETTKERFKENVITSYMFQAVVIDDITYLVPDLDKIAHQLVNLDS